MPNSKPLAPLRSEFKRKKVPWLCQHGHPLIQRGKSRVCLYCAGDILPAVRAGKPISYCSNGHARVLGRRCLLCESWRRQPMLRDLDINGVGYCPKGHEVTPETVYRPPSRPRRRECPVCWEQRLTNLQERARLSPPKQIKQGLNGTCTKGHPWVDGSWGTVTRRNGQKQLVCYTCRRVIVNRSNWRKAIDAEANSEVPAEHVDWVVVKTLIEYNMAGVMDLRRGLTEGPTAGEQWVAYCTWRAHSGREPYENYVTEARFIQWRDEGLRRGWRPLTFIELMASLADDAYGDGKILIP